jgi:mRNA interferase MazF
VNPGDVLLLPMGQRGGGPTKTRPVLLLALLPGSYQNLLVCGISTQMAAVEPNRDEIIQPGDSDFQNSGLHQASVIRLSFLRSADSLEVLSIIGSIDSARLDLLQTRLADHVHP